MTEFKKKPFILRTGEKISPDLVEQIQNMNADKPNFETYEKRIQEVFNLDPVIVTENKKIFLAGFIEGEGSISISIKKNAGTRFGIELDPLFNITQSLNGVNQLQLAHSVFRTGRIRYKSGSDKTLVFIIEQRLSLQESVRPFLQRYVFPNSCYAKQIKFQKFCQMLNLFDEGAHLDRERLAYELLPIWDEMRDQRSVRETFGSLEEAQDFVLTYTK